jgi:hypothetical protein
MREPTPIISMFFGALVGLNKEVEIPFGIRYLGFIL